MQPDPDIQKLHRKGKPDKDPDTRNALSIFRGFRLLEKVAQCTMIHLLFSEASFQKKKSCMQRLRVAYNFGCRALCNLPWRASVSSHQVQCNIHTFEALLRKYKYLFLEKCRKSNNLWLCALMQSDCLYSSLFFEHYNRILLCD